MSPWIAGPRLARPLALLLTAVVLSACDAAGRALRDTDHPLAGTIWDVSTGEEIAENALIERLDRADFIILGELHDNPEHHARQARLVAALSPAGIAFEMVPEASEEGIAVFRAQGGTPGEIGPAIGWERLGWPDWEMYRPIFEAAPEAYVAGGGVSRPALSAAMSTGAAAAFGGGARAYGLATPLPEPVRAALEAEMIAAHCDAIPARIAGPLVEAQRLRDARFAHALRRAAAAGGGQAVLITGNGHARIDRGVPAALREAVPDAEIVSLGQIEVSPGATEAAPRLAEAPYDLVWFSGRAERDDPCAAFR
ncbi:MAG: ChaN family lipoprotein [Paracoccaceae bacterium]